MDQSLLSSRAIMGMYFRRLEVDPGLAWINAVANLYNSDQSSETYNFLGQSPAMREWVGGRHAKGFSGDGITIVNKQYEATIEVAKRDIRRDKTGQIRARMEDFADRAQTHWASLLSTLILAGESTVCYDGQFYFDTDHSEGASGTQSNDISVDISTLPGAGDDNTPSAPNLSQMQLSIFAAVKQILSFKDDRGEPMNENASRFLVMVPTGLYDKALHATATMANGALPQNFQPNLLSRFGIDVAMNVRLNAWTDKFVVFRTDSPIKGLIRQTEQEVELKAKAEGSEFEFDNDAWQFGIDAWRGTGYGYWQHACLVTMV